ncbi:glutathione S-transferase, N-terminal domain containing protein [Nitzschia inconspicua]|uniref:Glutathione S-transferase, N-terminal domain containing protein n=1 Tax=Nitzschia inconspicua TaxID=303405 RepID=A0A9K3Q2I4_9STRA|nr:glutathione S-transferase, N-terminal domain containing protein [Nitzschia inconspicua]
MLLILFLCAFCRLSEGLSSPHSALSWEALERQLGASFSAPLPVSIDSVLNPNTPNFSTERPTLFRERHGWCPYSERVWLALELIGVDYDTVRIDNTGGSRPSYYGGETPQLRWPNGKQQGESMDLVKQLDATYNDGYFYQHAKVEERISAFRNIFPRARPSSRAAFLFQYNGEPLSRTTFEKTLDETNDLLGRTPGPFFCGDELSAADIAWTPFLERYRYQLPCLHDGLEPDDALQYPHMSAWYAAMDRIPVYACRVKGDAGSWRKVLKMAGFGNSGMPPAVSNNIESRINSVEVKLAKQAIDWETWEVYASGRPHVAATPHGEAAAMILRNRHSLAKDTFKQITTPSSPYFNKGRWTSTLPADEAKIEDLLMHLAQQLLDTGALKQISPSVYPKEVSSLARFLDERVCVPRDMGAMCAACLKLQALS